MKALLVGVLLHGLLPGLLALKYYEIEDQLLSSLKNNYSVAARPYNKTVVTSTLALFNLNKVDIGSEEISINGVMANIWHDPRLVWDPTVYGISTLIAKPTDIWFPHLTIENSVEKVEILDDKAPLRIRHDGIVMWTPSFTPTTSCAANIMFYPYDRQTCNVTLIGWTYNTDELELVTDTDSPVVTSHYSINGEWELTDTGYHYFTLVEATTGYSFRKLNFQISVRRKWQYYGQIIMLPVVLNSLLMAVVFALPIDSGERIGYCVTVLLSYIVLLTMVTANLPPISSQISIIQVYLSVVMCLGTLATMCTIGVLRLYHRDEEKNPVPGWMQSLAQSVLAPLTCRISRRVKGVSPNSSEIKITTYGKRSFNVKDIAEMLDSLFFTIFTLVMLSITITFISVLMIQY